MSRFVQVWETMFCVNDLLMLIIVNYIHEQCFKGCECVCYQVTHPWSGNSYKMYLGSYKKKTKKTLYTTL